MTFTEYIMNNHPDPDHLLRDEELHDEMVSLAEGYAKHIEQSRWIPVSERLPMENENVLFAWGNMCGIASHSNKSWITDHGSVIRPTHWQPIVPPKL